MMHFHYFRAVKKKGYLNSIAFLLFALMLFKVSSFHAYSHQDSAKSSIEDCKICELAIENHPTDYLLVASQNIILPFTSQISNEQQNTYTTVVLSSFLRFNFFGRPPPGLA